MKKILFVIMLFAMQIYLFSQTTINQNNSTNADLSKNWFEQSLLVKEPAEKIKLLKRAIILDENNYKALQELGLTYIKMGQIEMGQSYLKSASDIYKASIYGANAAVVQSEKNFFGIEKIGNIDIYKIEMQPQKNNETVGEKNEPREKIFLYLTPVAEIEKSEKSQTNSIPYFLTMTNLSYKPLQLKDIKLDTDISKNVSGFSIDKILNTDFTDLKSEYKNFMIKAYDTIILNIKALRQSGETGILSLKVIVEDEGGTIINKKITTELFKQ